MYFAAIQITIRITISTREIKPSNIMVAFKMYILSVNYKKITGTI